MKKQIAIILAAALLSGGLPLFPAFAQEAPQTLEEAESFGLEILSRLPDAMKDAWHNQALPTWLGMWNWVKGFWESTLGSKVENLWNKFLGFLGKDTQGIKKEFEKERKEMEKDIWERFKDLF